jgi:hypothetical protein
MFYELAKRSHDGILVRLLWDSLGDRVVVRYRDGRTGDAFAAEVPKNQALAAFRHPNIYRPTEFAAV